MSRLLKVSTAYNLVVFMTDSSDHVTGKTGLTLTITASKDGGSFGSISPTVTELATGWYKLALTTTHTNTVGDLALHITGTGADPTDLVVQVGDAGAMTTAADHAAALLATNVDAGAPANSKTLAQHVVLTLAALIAKTTASLEGSAPVIRDLGDTKNRIVLAYNAGIRGLTSVDGT